MFWNKYPYTDFHELNLDWIIAKIMELNQDFDEFKAVNTITNGGAWDITKQYQAWTIVSDNNIGYISLKPVPAGVAITNTEYWAQIVDYSATIADLNTRVGNLETAVTNLGNTVNNLGNRVTTLENTIDDILADEMIFLGDSYGVDATAGGKAWSSYVADVYPDAYYNMVGGTGFASDLYISDNNLTMLQAITVSDPDKVKSIFIFGGANDANLYSGGTATRNDILTRMAAFSAYVKTNFPNAMIYVGFVGWNRTLSVLAAYKECIQIYKDGAQACDNMVYISGLEGIMRNLDYINSLDLIHPTADASETLGEYILTAVKTRADVNYFKVFTVQLDTTGTSITNISGLTNPRAVYDNCAVQLKMFGGFNNFADISFESTTHFNLSYATSIKLASVSNCPRADLLPLASVVPAVIHVYGGSSYEVPVRLSIYEGDLYLMYLGLTSYNNVEQVLIHSPLEMTGYNE